MGHLSYTYIYISFIFRSHCPRGLWSAGLRNEAIEMEISTLQGDQGSASDDLIDT